MQQGKEDTTTVCRTKRLQAEVSGRYLQTMAGWEMERTWRGHNAHGGDTTYLIVGRQS